MLKVSGIDVFYGDLQVLWDVSFEVRDKEILVLVGANGAGKSTTLKTISGLLKPRKGSIGFDGVRLDELSPDKVIGQGVVHVPEARRLHKAREEALKAIDFCGLMPVKDVLAKALPIAGRKRLEITRAMATRPELLLLDETAAGLNPSELVEAIDLIQKIRANGTTIVIIEHIMHVIMTISDRIHAINFGQTIAEGTPKEVAANPAVIEAYLGTDYA